VRYQYQHTLILLFVWKLARFTGQAFCLSLMR
jgi:hypothetical protein